MSKTKQKGYLQIPRMLPAQRDYLNRKLDGQPGVTDADRRLYAHIVACAAYAPPSTQGDADRPVGVPVPYTVIQRHAKGANSFRLAELVTISDFKITDKGGVGYCRRYQPNDEHVNEFLNIAASMGPDEFSSTALVDFVSGRKLQPHQIRLKDENNHAEPALVSAAMRRLTDNGCYLNLDSLEAAYRTLESDCRANHTPKELDKLQRQ